MLRPVPSLHALRALRRQLSGNLSNCGSCESATSISIRRRAVQSIWKRQNSRVAQVSAVNRQRPVPSEYRELHESLKVLVASGATYVDPARLQLAVQGLESRSSILRIAIQGIHSRSECVRLVRILLADPLEPEQSWEKVLTADAEDRRALYIRHGEETRLDNQNPLVQTLFIPSRFLDRYGLELLVQPSAPTFRDRKTATIEQLLLPTLETPSAPGRTSPVQYPVHKTLLYGRGIDGLRSISRVLENLNIPQESSCIRGVVDVNWNSSLSDSSSSNVTLINLDDGETAVKAFRQSVKNSSQYEHCWINSNISAVETFIKDGIIEDSPKLKPAVKCLVSSIISDARAKVRSENKEAMNKIALATIPKDTREALQKSISLWAEGSHLELRSNVEQYILERSWRRLAWWKLFWRVDDVCMVVSDALRKVYLIRSEKGLLFLGGRLTEAGLFRSISVNAVPEGSSQLESSTSAPSSSAETTFTPATIPGEWIQNISQSRSFLLTALSPPLQAQAHKLLLKALSTSSLSVALSTLLYLSVTTPNLYEVGGIAAVGIVWSISQMQLRWESAKQAWIEEILSEGKKVLTTTEKQCRYDVEYGGRLSEDVVAASEREETQRALEKVEGALARTL